MKKRVITAVVGVPVLLLLIYLGGIAFAALVAVLMCAGTYEFYQMVRKERTFLLGAVLSSEAVMLIGVYLEWKTWASVGLMCAFLLIFIYAILHFPHINLNDMAVNFLAVLYIGWTLARLIAIEQLPYGTTMLFYLFVAIWCSDTGAYFAGRFLGRHKLAPHVSPHKTIEGAVGGVVATVVVLFLVNMYFQLCAVEEIIILGIVLSIVGQIGDLVESMFKRFLEVKDSGNILPGHGGVLDRFDSLIMAAPFLYYTIVVLVFLGYHI